MVFRCALPLCDQQEPFSRAVFSLPVRCRFTVFRVAEADTENCGICKQSNSAVCIECEVEGKEDCDIAIGECNHAFHFHCIKEWLNKKSTCPLCATEWQLSHRIEQQKA